MSVQTIILPIASQTIKDTVRGPIGTFAGEIYQTLGTGLSETVSKITFSASATGFFGFFPAIKVKIQCFTDDTLTGYCGDSTLDSDFSADTPILDDTQRVYTVALNPFSLNPNKHYRLFWIWGSSSNGGVDSISYYGSSSGASYPNGKCIASLGSDCTVQSPLADMYFILE